MAVSSMVLVRKATERIVMHFNDPKGLTQHLNAFIPADGVEKP